jgi:hypothetical protein
MMTLEFEGWFQCRFATDPDPTDDPRGVSGPCFTVAGEPPLDGIIRLNDFVKPRYPRAKSPGVTVTSVTVNGQTMTSHPLLGGAVRLLDEPRYQQRNMILVPQFPVFQAPIDPFHLEIEGNGVRISRVDYIDLAHPNLIYKDVFLGPLAQRRGNQMALQSVAVAEKTGFMNYGQVRQQRLLELKQRLAAEKDPVEQAALNKRIMNIENDRLLTGEMLAATQFLGLQATYSLAINGSARIDAERNQVCDEANVLQGTIGFSQPWPMAYWMGGYDVDTLFGYFAGNLSLPFYPGPKTGTSGS